MCPATMLDLVTLSSLTRWATTAALGMILVLPVELALCPTTVIPTNLARSANLNSAAATPLEVWECSAFVRSSVFFVCGTFFRMRLYSLFFLFGF